MADKKPTEMSSEELLAKEKTLKVSLAALGITIILLGIAGAYLLSNKGSSVFVILPVAFLPLLLALNSQLKAIKAEIARRNL